MSESKLGHSSSEAALAPLRGGSRRRNSRREDGDALLASLPPRSAGAGGTLNEDPMRATLASTVSGGRTSAASLHLTQRIAKGGIPAEHYRHEDEEDEGLSGTAIGAATRVTRLGSAPSRPVLRIGSDGVPLRFKTGPGHSIGTGSTGSPSQANHLGSRFSLGGPGTSSSSSSHTSGLGSGSGSVRRFQGVRRPHRVLVGVDRKRASAPELSLPMTREQSERLDRSVARLQPLEPLEARPGSRPASTGSAVGALVGAAHSGDPATQKGLELVAELLGAAVSRHPGVQRFMQLTRANSAMATGSAHGAAPGEEGKHQGSDSSAAARGAAHGELPAVLSLDQSSMPLQLFDGGEGGGVDVGSRVQAGEGARSPQYGAYGWRWQPCDVIALVPSL